MLNRKEADGRDQGVGVVLPGYIRREAAARYLGISLRTLTDWQAQRIIPFVKVSRKVTLFRLTDLDAAMNKFRVKAVGFDS